MIEVRRIKSDQIEPIRNWRNSQRNILRQNHIISKKEQENYFKKEVWPQDTLLDPRQILRSICIDKKLVGYGGLTNIDWPNKQSRTIISSEKRNRRGNAALFGYNVRIYTNILLTNVLETDCTDYLRKPTNLGKAH